MSPAIISPEKMVREWRISESGGEQEGRLGVKWRGAVAGL